MFSIFEWFQIFIFIFYERKTFCTYTKNKYICEFQTCPNNYWGQLCKKCHECIKGVVMVAGSKGSGKCICDKWSGILGDQCDINY